MSAAVASTCADVSEARLRLLGGFELIVDGAEVPVPYAVQRLLAFLALHRRSLDRVYVAGSLWSEMSERRAHVNLRATLWRSRVPGGELVRGSATHIGLSPVIDVDYHEASSQARALLQDEHAVGTSNESTVFGLDLLPTWQEEWVHLERERLRQLHLHALEVCCHRLIVRGDTAGAIDFGLAAVSAAPMRESAQRCLMRAHIAEGNQVEALRVFEAFRHDLWAKFRLRPSVLMQELVAPLQCAPNSA